MRLAIKAPAIPATYRAPLAILLPLVIMAAAYFFLLEGQMREKRGLESGVRSMRQEVARLTAMKGNMEKITKDYSDLKAKFEEKLRQMPEEKEVPDLLRQVSSTAQESRTHVRYFAPKETQPRDFYWELPFEMKYTAPYHSAGYFFDGIRALERIVHVTSFSLEAKQVGKKKVLEGTCLAKTYVFMKEPPPKAPAKPTQEKKPKPVQNNAIKVVPMPDLKNFAYTSVDRRDPFEPLYMERTARKKASGQSPKEGYDLDELKFVGVVKSGGVKSAMMEDVQGRGLLFKKGDFINKNLWVFDTLDDKLILAYKLKGDIHKISLDIPRK